ncbi:MAG: hypothetical protein ACD_19C00187G0030 [uncultured bacterium]|nr:MAG: hypothetical protein ACD_19C00187G0030 [uncultured bacterium]
MKTSWYSKNKQRTLENVKRWVFSNREKSNSYKKKWLLKHPNYKREWKAKNQSIQKVIKWLESQGLPIINGKNNGFCTNCGMKTLPKELFKYNNTFHCVECILDIRNTSTPESSEIKKINCSECGRETVDTTHDKCPDCRIIENNNKIKKIRISFGS